MAPHLAYARCEFTEDKRVRLRCPACIKDYSLSGDVDGRGRVSPPPECPHCYYQAETEIVGWPPGRVAAVGKLLNAPDVEPDTTRRRAGVRRRRIA